MSLENSRIGSTAPSSNDDEALTLQMMGIDEGLHDQREPVGAPTPRMRRLEHPGDWDRSAAIREIKDNHAAINQENGTTDALATANLLAKDKTSHDAKLACTKKKKKARMS